MIPYSKNSIEYNFIRKIVKNIDYYLKILMSFYSSYSLPKAKAFQLQPFIGTFKSIGDSLGKFYLGAVAEEVKKQIVEPLGRPDKTDDVILARILCKPAYYLAVPAFAFSSANSTLEEKTVLDIYRKQLLASHLVFGFALFLSTELPEVISTTNVDILLELVGASQVASLADSWNSDYITKKCLTKEQLEEFDKQIEEMFQQVCAEFGIGERINQFLNDTCQIDCQKIFNQGGKAALAPALNSQLQQLNSTQNKLKAKDKPVTKTSLGEFAKRVMAIDAILEPKLHKTLIELLLSIRPILTTIYQWFTGNGPNVRQGFSNFTKLVEFAGSYVLFLIVVLEYDLSKLRTLLQYLIKVMLWQLRLWRIYQMGISKKTLMSEIRQYLYPLIFGQLESQLRDLLRWLEKDSKLVKLRKKNPYSRKLKSILRLQPIFDSKLKKENLKLLDFQNEFEFFKFVNSRLVLLQQFGMNQDHSLIYYSLQYRILNNIHKTKKLTPGQLHFINSNFTSHASKTDLFREKFRSFRITSILRKHKINPKNIIIEDSKGLEFKISFKSGKKFLSIFTTIVWTFYWIGQIYNIFEDSQENSKSHVIKKGNIAEVQRVVEQPKARIKIPFPSKDKCCKKEITFEYPIILEWDIPIPSSQKSDSIDKSKSSVEVLQFYLDENSELPSR